MPFFQDKILQSFSKNEEIQVTNDGATILKSIGVDNPAAKILVGKNSKYFYMKKKSLQGRLCLSGCTGITCRIKVPAQKQKG